MRRIFKSTVLMGLASVVDAAAGMVRLKTFALLLGPPGVGFLAILQSITSTLATLSDFGLGGAATRELARVRERAEEAASVRRSILLLANLFGVAGGALLWTLRQPLAVAMFGDREDAAAVGILSLAIFFSSVASARFGILAAYRLVEPSARARILAATSATVLAIAAVWRFGVTGLPWAVVAGQGSLLVAAWLVEPSALRGAGPRSKAALARLRPLLGFGGVVMVATAATAATGMIVRGYLARQMGLGAAGEYQAVWSLSMLVTGLALAAASMEFFPQAAAEAAAGRPVLGLLEGQLRFSVLLAAPVLLVFSVFPELTVRLFFSADFTTAPAILRWQVTGDLLRVVAWVQGLALLACSQLWDHLVLIVLWNLAYLGLVAVVAERLGLSWVGVAVGLSYLPLVVAQSWRLRRTLSAVARRGLGLAGLLSLLLLALAGLGQVGSGAAPVARLAAGAAALWCLATLAHGLAMDRPTDSRADDRLAPAPDRLLEP